jgi:hypothetical protein
LGTARSTEKQLRPSFLQIILLSSFSFFTSKINGGQQRAGFVIPFDCFSRVFSSGIPLVKLVCSLGKKEKKNRPALSPSLDKEFTADSRSALVGLDVAARPHFQLPRRQIIGQLL